MEQPIWANVARIVSIVDELVLTGKPTNIEFKQQIKPVYEDFMQVLNRTLIRTQEIKQDKAVSFLMSETCIIDDIFKVLNCLWPVSLFETSEQPESKESEILGILSRISDDDFARDIDLLMFDGIKDKKSSNAETHDYFLRSITNLICLKISIIQDKDELEKWLEILLRMSKYLLLTSETWT